jgi:D-alanyl-D-alanine carboxypeptidase
MLNRDFTTLVDALLTELGGGPALRIDCRLPWQPEAKDLVSAGLDIFDREQYMTPQTLSHWQAMAAAAKQDRIELQLISAFRSVDYQCQLVRRKALAGQTLDDIFRVSAIPGFSEHHTGCALDISCPDSEPLEESFESTHAFAWLRANASKFNFFMSYPRNNAAGIIYEPWHWACRTR